MPELKVESPTLLLVRDRHVTFDSQSFCSNFDWDNLAATTSISVLKSLVADLQLNF